MGVFNLGGVIGALRPPKLKRIEYSKPLMTELEGPALQNVSNVYGQNVKDVGLFSGDVTDAINQIKAFAPEDQAYISSLLGRQSAYDPMETYRTLRRENLGALNEQAGFLTQQGRRAESEALARLGMGGGRGSSYQDILRQGRVNTAIAPITSQIFGSLGSDTYNLSNLRGQDIAQTLGLLDARTQIPQRTLALRTMPMAARTGALNDYLSGLSGLGGTIRGNIAGFKEEEDKLAAAFKAGDEALNSALDIAVSLYGGGMLGGFGGGKPNKSPKPSTPPPRLPFSAAPYPYLPNTPGPMTYPPSLYEIFPPQY